MLDAAFFSVVGYKHFAPNGAARLRITHLLITAC